MTRQPSLEGCLPPLNNATPRRSRHALYFSQTEYPADGAASGDDAAADRRTRRVRR